MIFFNETLRLSFSLAKANFKLRNEGSFLGFFWYLLNPLAYFTVLIFIKGTVFAHHDIAHYPVYLIAGLVMYNFFVHTVGDSIGIIRSNSGLIKSVRIKTEALVVSRVIQSFFSHIFEILLLAAFLVYFQINILHIFLYLPIYLIFGIFILGISFFFSTLGIFFSDLRHIWGIFTQLLFFVTPVFYVLPSGGMLSEINAWNPLSYFLSASREALINGNLPTIEVFVVMVVSSVLSLAIGAFVFSKLKHSFAELV